jgi:uncharacterized protein DUF6448
MPPHCDSMDGPVVRAAQEALDREDVGMILPYVPETGEPEVRRVFDLVVKARAQGAEAREVADRFFFETVVRVHRAGEGAAYTGLKPAGLDVGPVIPLAEAAIRRGDPSELSGFLADATAREIGRRFERVMEARNHAGEGTVAARAYVTGMLGFQVWAHKLYGALGASAHGEGGSDRGPNGR